jgi:hypothetical protein
MGGSSSKEATPRTEVPGGKVRVCVAGFGLSHHTGRARSIAESVVGASPEKFESWFYFNTSGYKGEGGLLSVVKKELTVEQQDQFAQHKSSPFCWLEYPDGKKLALGGRDNFCDWVNNNAEFKEDFAKNAALKDLTTTMPGLGEAWVDESSGTAQCNNPVVQGRPSK